MREKYTYQRLRSQCASLGSGAVLVIKWQHFNDLKQDIEFVNSFAWAFSQQPLTEFQCDGVTCMIQKEPKQ